ncbi:hypothetical protein J437_LFUL002277 [Ladona fulva]|uniref:MADF domain-containing protein n=1 Tax=Ladona fulva TaxID=123851 RepID=A0A8K0JY52_LADFU|nr:hypothetical protein J437_LFUL002277 [Ladona fulva]
MVDSVASKSFMNPEFLARFIELYHDLPALWNVGDADYTNRAKRSEAWDTLVEFTRSRIRDADLPFVKKKLESIRASFRKELRRVKESRRSGVPEEYVYKPTLWYYDLLLFTAFTPDQESLGTSKSNLKIEFEEDHAVLNGPESRIETKTREEPRDPEEQISNHVLQSRPRKRKKLKKSPTAHLWRQSLIQKVITSSSKRDDEYDTLGKTYAAKLRRMPASQRDLADRLIHEVLFRGLMNNLTPSTCLSFESFSTGDVIPPNVDTPR